MFELIHQKVHVFDPGNIKTIKSVMQELKKQEKSLFPDFKVIINLLVLFPGRNLIFYIILHHIDLLSIFDFYHNKNIILLDA
jgi:hypothetical protein